MNKLFPFLILLFCICDISAQNINPEVVSSAGESSQGNSIQIDWTLGEVAILTLQNSTQQITQGFHQPNYIISSINDSAKEIGEVNIYPNPTSDFLEINLALTKNEQIQIQIVDLLGNQLLTKHIEGMNILERVNLYNLPSSYYFIIISFEESKYSKTFKVQKIH